MNLIIVGVLIRCHYFIVFAFGPAKTASEKVHDLFRKVLACFDPAQQFILVIVFKFHEKYQTTIASVSQTYNKREQATNESVSFLIFLIHWILLNHLPKILVRTRSFNIMILRMASARCCSNSVISSWQPLQFVSFSHVDSLYPNHFIEYWTYEL